MFFVLKKVESRFLPLYANLLIFTFFSPFLIMMFNHQAGFLKQKHYINTFQDIVWKLQLSIIQKKMLFFSFLFCFL